MKKLLLILFTFCALISNAQVQYGGVTNVTKIGGTAVDVNSGNKSAGTQRVVLATDQPPVNTVLTSSSTAAAAGVKATMTAYGYLRTTLEPRLEFVDPFDGGTVDVTNNWTQSGTVTQVSGACLVGNITTTTTVNSLTSKPTFAPLGISFQVMAFTASFESSPLSTTNVNRFFGFGTHSGTPSTTTPVTDGVGFEWDPVSAKLYGAVWVNGTRSASSVDLTAYVTASATRYAVLYRSDLAIFYVTGTEIPVGSVSFVTPYTQSLPVKLQTVIGASAPSATPANSLGAVTVGETGGNSINLSDGTYPFRKATISSTGALKVDGSSFSQPISAASLPLPTGASTAAKQPALGTAGTASSDVITVQGIASMTAIKVDGSAVTQPISAASLPLPTNAATSANVTGLQVAQASTTSGQSGTLVQGAVTTSAPTYTTAQTSPLSLSTAGDLRVVDSRLPTALGQLSAATSLGVTLSNENVQDLFITGQSAQTATVNNIIPATAGASATDLTGYRSANIQIICPAGTYTTGAITFEGSNDNSNFVNFPVYNQLILTGTPITGAITLVTTTFIGYTFPVNFRYVRCRISTAVSGASASVQAVSKFSQTSWTPPVVTIANATAANANVTASIASAQTLATVSTVTTVSTLSNTTQLTPGTAAANLGKAEDAASASGDVGPLVMGIRNDALTSNVSANGDYSVPVQDIYGAQIIKDQQRHKRTYSCAFTVTPAATATDIFQLIGSATTTVEITKIVISGTQTTGGMVDVYLAKRSTANTGGTSTSATMVPHISTDAAATAVGSIYTANPTTGTLVGNVRIFSLPLSAITATTQNIYEVNFGQMGKPIILSGVAQAFAVTLNSTTVTGGNFKMAVEYTEY